MQNLCRLALSLRHETVLFLIPVMNQHFEIIQKNHQNKPYEVTGGPLHCQVEHHVR